MRYTVKFIDTASRMMLSGPGERWGEGEFFKEYRVSALQDEKELGLHSGNKEAPSINR